MTQRWCELLAVGMTGQPHSSVANLPPAFSLPWGSYSRDPIDDAPTSAGLIDSNIQDQRQILVSMTLSSRPTWKGKSKYVSPHTLLLYVCPRMKSTR